jgi:cation diffusion facilitator family transporter
MESVKIDRLKEGQRVTKNVILVSLILVVFKGIIGFFSGSVALISDAVHTGADSITTFASWFGLKIAERKPTEKFPYGYYKAETIATFFICIFLLFAGYELITESYSKLFILPILQIPYWALAICLISAVLAFFVAKYERKIGEEINSQSLITIAQESRIDILISLVVFLGILSTHFKIPYVEGIVGILISLMIFKVALENGKNAIYSLMDVNPSQDIEERIKKLIKKIPGVESFEDLKLRRAGPFIFGDVKIKTKKFLTVKRAHEISDNIENKIKKEISQIESFNIHIEPSKKERQKLVIPVNNKNGFKSKVSNHFARANYFIFIDMDGKNVKSHYFKENKYKRKKVRAGLFFIQNVILNERVDEVITKQIGAISFHTLRDNLIDIYLAKKNTVEKNVNDFVNDKLERLKEPTKKLGQEKVERRIR